MGETTDNQSIV